MLLTSQTIHIRAKIEYACHLLCLMNKLLKNLAIQLSFLKANIIPV